MKVDIRKNRAIQCHYFVTDLFRATYASIIIQHNQALSLESKNLCNNCTCSQTIVQISSGVDLAKICILVLDRNAKSAHAIGQILKSIGCQVSITTDHSEAVALAEKQLFNLVVEAFDPDTMDAIAFMNSIRAITPDTQFIFASDKGT